MLALVYMIRDLPKVQERAKTLVKLPSFAPTSFELNPSTCTTDIFLLGHLATSPEFTLDDTLHVKNL